MEQKLSEVGTNTIEVRFEISRINETLLPIIEDGETHRQHATKHGSWVCKIITLCK